MGRASGTIPILRIASTGSWPPWLGPSEPGPAASPSRSTSAGGPRGGWIGGGARVRLDRLIELIGRTLGREVRIERHGDQPGDVRLTDADLRRAGRELGFRPKVGIEEGIRLFVRWYEAMHGRQS